MVDAGPGEMGMRRLDVTYKPAYDLAIARVVSAYFNVPDHYQSRGGVQVFGTTPQDTKLLQGVGLALGPAGDVRFPWMDGTTYPLAVWYYCVRQVRVPAAHCLALALILHTCMLASPLTHSLPSLFHSHFSSLHHSSLHHSITFPLLHVIQVLTLSGDAGRALLWSTPVTLRGDHPLPELQETRSRASGTVLRVGAGRTQGRRGYVRTRDPYSQHLCLSCASPLCVRALPCAILYNMLPTHRA